MKDFRTKYIYFLSALIFLTGLGLLGWFSWNYFNNEKFSLNFSEDDAATTTLKDNCNYRRILDGVCVVSADKINPKLVGVMVENHIDARPQSGLVEASIVYEAPVEANYTRFLAIYTADSDVKKIGPVRSVRPYYLDWLSEYGTPLYMHVGGSPEALGLIDQYKINDLNEFYRGWFYWRDDARTAPHNVYTSSELWNKALNNYLNNYTNDNFQGWQFATTTLVDSTTLTSVNNIRVSFLSPVYEAVWKYNSSTNQYVRYQMDTPHIDEYGKMIVADTVVVEIVDAKVIDEIGRQELATIGKGELRVFKNGGVVKGYWQKTDRTSRTKFYDENNQEILLNPGHIWIEVATSLSKVTIN